MLAITTLLRVCPIPFFLFSQLNIYILLFHQLVGCFHSFFGENDQVPFFRRYKLDYYTTLRQLWTTNLILDYDFVPLLPDIDFDS